MMQRVSMMRIIGTVVFLISLAVWIIGENPLVNLTGFGGMLAGAILLLIDSIKSVVRAQKHG
ncbi:hypothetical protein [Thalassobacillus hwangdonensis]|uniref:Uncharacterized protein n=1 Tax=Thalassobacillus hwangdonensis TaxID=546108 RepID=A0ABW3L1Y9_9BACI